MTIHFHTFESGVIGYGGPGSGNFGHSGRPGKVGGSGGTDKFDGQDIQMFHGTSSDYIESIRTNGLIPGGQSGADAIAESMGWHSCISEVAGQKVSVFLTPELRVASSYAGMTSESTGGTAVILKVRVPLSEAQRITNDPKESEGMKFRGKIRPEWIDFDATIIERSVGPKPDAGPISIKPSQKRKKILLGAETENSVFYIVALMGE